MARTVEDILKVQIGGLVIQLADSIAKQEALNEQLEAFRKSEGKKPIESGQVSEIGKDNRGKGN